VTRRLTAEGCTILDRGGAIVAGGHDMAVAVDEERAQALST
jgi:hypothetical protein